MDMTNFWRSAAMAACPLCTTQGVGDDEGLAGVAATDAPAVLAEDESLGAEPVPLRPAGRSSVAHSSGVAPAVAQALAQRMGVSVNDVEVAATASPDGSGVEFAYAVQPGSAESADVLSSETAVFYVTALHAEDIAYVEQVAPGASVTAGDRKGVRLRQCAVCRHELAKAAYSRSQWGRTLGRGAPTCMDCLQPRSRNSECSEPMSTQGVGDDGSPTGPRGLTKDVGDDEGPASTTASNPLRSAFSCPWCLATPEPFRRKRAGQSRQQREPTQVYQDWLEDHICEHNLTLCRETRGKVWDTPRVR